MHEGVTPDQNVMIASEASIEKSCGALVFTRMDADIQYLLVRSLEGYWGFPKGHMEAGETEQETALREIMEETGVQVALLEGFRTTDEHPLLREGKPHTIKRIVYFLGECKHQEVHAQESEISQIAFMRFEQAMTAFQFESSKRILQEAHSFLTKQKKQ